MRRKSPVSVLVVLAILAMALLVACQQSAPPAAPTAAVVPTTAPVPAATLAPATATKPPATATVPPTAVRTATPAPTPKAVTPAVSSPRAGATPSAASESINELSAAMDQAMPTLMALLPTAPPTPSGQPAVLSQSDLGGRWDGWLTIESVKLTGATPEDQQACDSQLKVIKGRQIPMGMEFQPKSADSGDVVMINKETDGSGTTTESQGSTSPYKYQSGTLTMTADEATATSTLEGKSIKTDSGFAITGTWKSTTSDLSTGLQSGTEEVPAVIEGTWTVVKSK